jgi:hypothetical protein
MQAPDSSLEFRAMRWRLLWDALLEDEPGQPNDEEPTEHEDDAADVAA